jgi:hypothetical protein
MVFLFHLLFISVDYRSAFNLTTFGANEGSTERRGRKGERKLAKWERKRETGRKKKRKRKRKRIWEGGIRKRRSK